MLTRLKVKGFKNLADVDVAFGPFTCVAGVNGVGKSNLFDAITFLSAISHLPLIDAARCVRDEKNRSNEVRSLFFRAGDETVDEMTFIAEMLIPVEGIDELGQPATASITCLQYKLVLGYETDAEVQQVERLVVRCEELQHIKVGDAPKRLAFDHSREWRQSVVRGRRSSPFISTSSEPGNIIVTLHQEIERGRARQLQAAKLPRTVLSSTNATENPTAFLTKCEMQSWRLLQLEPTALRNPDPFNAPTHIGADGSHMAATLNHLARTRANESNGDTDSEALLARLANRLSELVEDVQSVSIDHDTQRGLFVLQIVDRSQTAHPARALSDGTLRFLALSILELDTSAHGLLCFEEPENGIHPERIPAMLQLLTDLATDTTEEVGQDNPLRQVIVNTHSPTVVALVDDADLLVAEPCEVFVNDYRCRAVRFSWLEETWRQDMSPEERTLSRGKLRVYLNPLAVAEAWMPNWMKVRNARGESRIGVIFNFCYQMSRGLRMNDLKFTFLTDGSSDQVLIRHLQWIVRKHLAPTTTIQLEWADLRSIHPKPANLSERIQRAIELYPCDLLFVHRDAERQNPQLRYDEIADAIQSLPVAESVVGVVPVRMQEAWLLFDESAIRKAAGNPNGRVDLGLPSLRKCESLPDPKSDLQQCLRTASGLTGRRLRLFRGRQAARRVAEYLEDFSPLLQLDAFRKLDSDIDAELRRRNWAMGQSDQRQH